MAVGGSIQSIAIKNRLFPVAADADAERDLGGFTNEVKSNGDGSAILVKTRKPWSIGGVTVEIDDERQDQEFLQEIADGNAYVPIVVTLVTGISYSGTGQIVDDLAFSTQNSTAELTLSGGQKLEQQ